MANRWRKSRNSGRFYFLELQNQCRQWLQPRHSKTHTPWKKSYDKPRQCIKKPSHHLANKGPTGQGYSFSSSHVWMWEGDHKVGWAPKNWCFWTVVLEKTLESPLECKKVQPFHPKRAQSWGVFCIAGQFFARRTTREAMSGLPS